MVLRKVLLAVGIGAVTIAGLEASSLEAISEEFAPTPNSLPKSSIAQQPNCKNPQTQPEMNACSRLDYQQADKKLQQVYDRLRSKLTGTSRQQLISGQTAWIVFRDSNCEFQKSLFEGGSIAPTMFNGCLSDITQQRTSELEMYLQSKIPAPISPSLQGSDRNLNQIYKQIMSKLAPQSQNKLKLVQRNWIAFRDANCKFEVSLARTNSNFCRARMSEQRTKSLTDLNNRFF
ncbi:MAG: lysozyme inhibitor LprI family protein [Oscillatoriaceae cyanobacterium Prado104]|jgi:uncharacterized protein YecT (DUF1311 family)|nr:lysozyme inhibitor LprI family protein [Oscillatoriaceae cyanobacterium Prado104]